MPDGKLSFSQKRGLKPIAKEIQIETMDDELRNSLWNGVLIFVFLDGVFENLDHTNRKKAIQHRDLLVRLLWLNHFTKPLDTLPNLQGAQSYIRNHFFDCEWYDVYDMLEFFLANSDSQTSFPGGKNYLLNSLIKL